VAAKQSAGLLLYRRHQDGWQVFRVHPGGHWKTKGQGAWSIPKGEFEPGEDPLEAAKREFREETGLPVAGPFVPLKPVGDEFLFGSGYVYVGPLWDKAAAEFFQTATIAAPADGYEIWRDAARLARNPAGAHFPTGFPLPRVADKVLAFGFSRTGV